MGILVISAAAWFDTVLAHLKLDINNMDITVRKNLDDDISDLIMWY